MKPTPKDWPRISSAVFYEDPAAAIDWLCTAFGFEVRLKVEGEGGSIVHSELTYGDGLVMVGGLRTHEEDPNRIPCASPRGVEGKNTQALCVFVDDAEAHCAHAKAAGAVIADVPAVHDYGDDYWADKTYRAVDPEGHHWWFMERVRG
ncbi:VOC family protein [Paraliomyxa miuraensis]|uniref:VOC family protein n=1 Tax=Paraliomyxa miuraensis TaxID=376150 RepID=UPI00225A63A9|nr:VOC family protein [Paraliomyxa miuraensis]MCX4247970.1 VOC family protein [Paraliomyxa miuraensis]